MRFSIQKITGLALATVLLCLAQSIYAQDDPKITAIQQKLKEQFVLTRLASNGDIVAEGSVLVLQKEGLQMCSTASPLPLESTYKNGKLSGGTFGWGMALALMSKDSNTIPQVKFMPGDKFQVTAYSVDKSGVHFKFWSDPINGIRYYGLLKIAFAKGSYPSADDVMKTIAEVVSIDPGESAARNVPAPAPAVQLAPAPAGLPAAPLKLPATFICAQAPADQLQLDTDNSFSLQEGGQPYHGTFMANGGTLELNISETGTRTSLIRQGNDLIDNSGQTWRIQVQSTGTASSDGAVLHNEDVVKMAKAGVDDSIVISKINNSKCQFDTSTDALVQLKKNGVNTPVLKAMFTTGK